MAAGPVGLPIAAGVPECSPDEVRRGTSGVAVLVDACELVNCAARAGRVTGWLGMVGGLGGVTAPILGWAELPVRAVLRLKGRARVRRSPPDW